MHVPSATVAFNEEPGLFYTNKQSPGVTRSPHTCVSATRCPAAHTPSRARHAWCASYHPTHLGSWLRISCWHTEVRHTGIPAPSDAIPPLSSTQTLAGLCLPALVTQQSRTALQQVLRTLICSHQGKKTKHGLHFLFLQTHAADITGKPMPATLRDKSTAQQPPHGSPLLPAPSPTPISGSGERNLTVQQQSCWGSGGHVSASELSTFQVTRPGTGVCFGNLWTGPSFLCQDG